MSNDAPAVVFELQHHTSDWLLDQSCSQVSIGVSDLPVQPCILSVAFSSFTKPKSFSQVIKVKPWLLALASIALIFLFLCCTFKNLLEFLLRVSLFLKRGASKHVFLHLCAQMSNPSPAMNHFPPRHCGTYNRALVNGRQQQGLKIPLWNSQ